MDDQRQLADVAKDIYRESQEHETKNLAASLNMGYADIRFVNIPDSILSYLSKDEVIKYKAIPLKLQSGKLVLGVVHNEIDLSELKKTFLNDYAIIDIVPVMISEKAYLDWLPSYNDLEKKEIINNDENTIDLTKIDKMTSFEQLDEELKKAQLQDLLKLILFSAFDMKASDIHIEPKAEMTRIRFRIDGTLHEVAKLTEQNYKFVLSQVELHANLKLNSKNPQQGRFSIKFSEKDLGVRIETMPSLYGDDIVMRLFATETATLKIEDLGLEGYAMPKVEKALKRPHGMILMVGPTGSGKTSTIYAILNVLNSESVKIITLEDPVEYRLEGAIQSQINEGESFAERLKAVLREDPDIIMVGEIRDPATAETAIQAALTGHLMVSTLHANDSVTAIARLEELVHEPSLIAASTNIIIAQRLVRKICDKCKKEYNPTPFERAEFERIFDTIPLEIREGLPSKFYYGTGCDDCKGIGYKGRIGIFEILELGKEMQKAVNDGASIYDLRETAMKAGMMTMEQDGIIKTLRGITSIGEVLRTIKE